MFVGLWFACDYALFWCFMVSCALVCLFKCGFYLWIGCYFVCLLVCGVILLLVGLGRVFVCG